MVMFSTTPLPELVSDMLRLTSATHPHTGEMAWPRITCAGCDDGFFGKALPLTALPIAFMKKRIS